MLVAVVEGDRLLFVKIKVIRVAKSWKTYNFTPIQVIQIWSEALITPVVFYYQLIFKSEIQFYINNKILHTSMFEPQI